MIKLLFKNTVTAVVCISFLPAFMIPQICQADTMSGYSRDDFGDFTKDWRLVTVRYRKDSGEMRFTYANDLAWRTLRDNKTDYPKGSIFGKVSFRTTQDISFPSSMVPTTHSRTQLMVRDEEKHKETDGWGYAIFDATGKVFSGDLRAKAQACAACHRLVSERGEVFSRILGTKIANYMHFENPWQKLVYKTNKAASLPKAAQKRLKAKFSRVRMLQGELRDNLFFGTLDEIRPALAREAIRTNLPAALTETGGDRFALVIPKRKSKKCAEDSVEMVSFHTVPNKNSPIIELSFCEKK